MSHVHNTTTYLTETSRQQMEQSNEPQILSSLQNYGVLIPPTITTLNELTSSTLITICSQSLRLIDPTTTTLFPTSLPEDEITRLNICADFASAFKDLGFVGDISSHNFLYPSEEDSCKLVRFMVEKLSELSRESNSFGVEDVNSSAESREDDTNSFSEDRNEKDANGIVDIGSQTAEEGLRVLNLNTEISGKLKAKDKKLDSVVTVSQKGSTENLVDPLRSGSFNIRQDKSENVQDAGDSNSGLSDHRHDLVPDGNVASQKMQSSKETYEVERLKNQEKMLQEELASKTIEIKHLEEELELLNAAAEIACDAEHSTDSCVEQLTQKVDSKRLSLVEVESEWDAVRKPLEDQKRSLEESLYATIPEGLEKLGKIKVVELEKESVLSEIERRKEEQFKLIAELEKQPNVESRRSHIQRILEITKNNQKQDTDIERILKETRELQLENNSIQECLHRTYAVLDELVFRESKKDSAGRQAYRLLTSMHENFEQISKQILATDRLRREIVDYETKLAAMASRSKSANKFQANLDAIRKENESIEQCLLKN